MMVRTGPTSTLETARSRALPSDPTLRPDEPERVAKHAGLYRGGVALVVLGGPSGARWEEIRKKVKPDVLLTANGATRLPANYWLLTENMNYCHRRARNGDQQAAEFLHVLDPGNTARNLFISHRTWNLLGEYGIDVDRCTRIRRSEILTGFTMRSYGEGFMAGPLSQATEAWQTGVKTRLGTVGAQLLHLAGILGCREVHTIGFDLVFPDPERHHWYGYPKYTADHFRRPEMFVNHEGVNTQAWWVETARWLKALEPLMEGDGLVWTDHSHGLLELEGLRCATR